MRMTREQFLERQRTFESNLKSAGIVHLLIFFSVPFTFGVLIFIVDPNKHPLVLWLSLVCVGWFFWWPYWSQCRIKKMVKELGLACERCEKPLTKTAGMIATASGRCGHCGVVILTD
jgi:hypothetical protein